MGQVSSTQLDYDYQDSSQDSNNSSDSKKIDSNSTKKELDTKVETIDDTLQPLLDLLKYYTHGAVNDKKFNLKNNLIIGELDIKVDEVNKLLKENDSRILTLKDTSKYNEQKTNKLKSINMYLKYAALCIVLITAYIKIRMY